jgi:rubrerythrin
MLHLLMACKDLMNMVEIQQLAESTDNRLAQEVLYDIANEEKEHAGEFLRLLRELDPEEEKFYQEGYEEVEEMIAKLKK